MMTEYEITDFDVMVEWSNSRSNSTHFCPHLNQLTVERVDMTNNSTHSVGRFFKPEIDRLHVEVTGIPEELRAGGALSKPTDVEVDGLRSGMKVNRQVREPKYDNDTELWKLVRTV